MIKLNKKYLVLFFLFIFSVLMSGYVYFFNVKPEKYKDRTQESFFTDIKKSLNIDLTPLLKVSLPKNLDTILNNIENEPEFKHFNKMVSNGINTQENIKLTNGLKELTSFTYDDISTSIDIYIWDTAENADNSFSAEFNNTNLKIKKYVNNTEKIYIVYANDTSLYKCLLQYENMYIHISQNKESNNNDNINKLIKLLAKHLSNLN